MKRKKEEHESESKVESFSCFQTLFLLPRKMGISGI